MSSKIPSSAGLWPILCPVSSSAQTLGVRGRRPRSSGPRSSPRRRTSARPRRPGPESARRSGPGRGPPRPPAAGGRGPARPTAARAAAAAAAPRRPG
eukprot:710983-Alexandrium_andersonii.AAC.1